MEANLYRLLFTIFFFGTANVRAQTDTAQFFLLFAPHLGKNARAIKPEDAGDESFVKNSYKQDDWFKNAE